MKFLYNCIKKHYIGKICVPITDWLRFHEFIDDKTYEQRLKMLLHKLNSIKFT